MKINSTLLCVSLLLSHSAMSQKEGNNWYFGMGAGLSFNGCSVSVLTDGVIDGYEGCATVSDKHSGQLLFYTNSDKVWNKNHQLMSNGELKPSTNSITQVLIVPYPGNPHKYLIFTTDMQANNYKYGLCYSEVDISKNGGLGEVVSKDNLLYPSNLTEKIIAIRHANGKDIWIITHECGNNNYLAFLLSPAGLSTVPVVSSLGKVHEYNLMRSNWDAIGELKASPDGKRIVSVTYDKNDADLFYFNKATGKLSFPISIPLSGASSGMGGHSRLYGTTFSPNSKLLYITVGEFPASLYQYDISSNNPALIKASETVLFSDMSSSIYGLKLASDGKIYAGGDFRDYLGVIEYPDQPGIACHYIHNGLYLAGKKSGWGLNNLMEETSFCNSLPPQTISMPGSGAFPNPAVSDLMISVTAPSYDMGTIIVFDALGKVVRQESIFIDDLVSFKRNALEAGLYYYRIESASGLAENGKFLFQ